MWGVITDPTIVGMESFQVIAIPEQIPGVLNPF
jgi:hypothetical protein